MRLLVFGFGYSGRTLARRLSPQGWDVVGTVRDPAERATTPGAIDPSDAEALARASDSAEVLLVSAPPGEDGCPGLRALAPLLAGRQTPLRIAYLSTTGVYGDRGGGWVFERSAPAPASREARRRAEAEAAWLALGREIGCDVAVFRLPGIYGPGRSALDRVRAGEARRIVKPGHVFSRIHVEDLAAGLEAWIAAPPRHAVFNLCDDTPAPAADVTAWAARLLGVAPPPEQPFDPATLSTAAHRFWAESKRVSNARAKAALGWRPAYPSYREGLAAILAAEALKPAPPLS